LADDAGVDPSRSTSDVETSAGYTAPKDAILAERLGVPSSPDAIYLEEASVYRPIATGDIFLGVELPGLIPEETGFGLSMLLSHPSAMRRGAQLEARARAAPITPVNGLSRTKWPPGHYDVFPLPLLASVAEANGFQIGDRGWGVLIELSVPIWTRELDFRRRIACLSPDGIHLLLQRVVHADTRFPVREDLLAAVFEPKLEELEMLQTWNEELVAPLVDEIPDLQAALNAAAMDFERTVSSSTHRTKTSIRGLLESGVNAGEAHRLLVEAIRSRRTMERQGHPPED
jgi:hypothetical protein